MCQAVLKNEPAVAASLAAGQPHLELETSHTSAAEGIWVRGIERRDVASRHELSRRIEMEYHDMPGLRLTPAQAIRLFGLKDDICLRMLDALVGAKILRRTADGMYVGNNYGR
jgi:hypothetical protein